MLIENVLQLFLYFLQAGAGLLVNEKLRERTLRRPIRDPFSLKAELRLDSREDRYN